jgi:hypothetical protein
VFEEAEPEFHTMAFFKTTIRVRNALQDEMVPQVSSDQEALLINLSRPIMLAQPAAFDKGIYYRTCSYWFDQPTKFHSDSFLVLGDDTDSPSGICYRILLLLV